jgi:hypothetical protein
MEILLVLGFGAACVVVGIIAGSVAVRRERRAYGGDDDAA